MYQCASVVEIIRKSGPSSRECIHHPQAQLPGDIALRQGSEGSPIRLCGGGIRHCCTIAAAQTHCLRYWVDCYLYYHHCSFLFSCHLRRKYLDVSAPLLVVEGLVTCRKVVLEQLEQGPGRQI